MTYLVFKITRFAVYLAGLFQNFDELIVAIVDANEELVDLFVSVILFGVLRMDKASMKTQPSRASRYQNSTHFEDELIGRVENPLELTAQLIDLFLVALGLDENLKSLLLLRVLDARNE